MTTPTIDQAKAGAFQMKMMQVVAAVTTLKSLRLGKELGLFTALKENGPQTSKDLASSLSLSTRYTYEWCLMMTANEIMEYNADDDTFALPPEHAQFVCSDEGLMGMMVSLQANTSPQYPLLKLAFQTNGGIFWGDMPSMDDGARAYFKPVYEQLMPGWIDLIPALKTVMAKEGTRIADIGCGEGVSTRALAKLFPNAQVLGIDYHEGSILKAKEEIANYTNASVRVIDSHNWVTKDDEESYSVLTMFDCFHDMSDPEGVAAECYKALSPGGMIFMIEPLSSYEDSTKAKLGVPPFFVYQGFNMCYCTPCGMSVPGKEGLGSTAGTERYEAIFANAGYASLEVVGANESGPTAPTTHGFRVLLVIK